MKVKRKEFLMNKTAISNKFKNNRLKMILMVMKRKINKSNNQRFELMKKIRMNMEMKWMKNTKTR